MWPPDSWDRLASNTRWLMVGTKSSFPPSRVRWAISPAVPTAGGSSRDRRERGREGGREKEEEDQRGERGREEEVAAMALSSSRSSRLSASSGRGKGGGEMERLSSPVPYRVGPYDYSPEVKCHSNRKAPCWTSWSDDNPDRRYLYW
jgi:hypothetical protein